MFNNFEKPERLFQQYWVLSHVLAADGPHGKLEDDIVDAVEGVRDTRWRCGDCIQARLRVTYEVPQTYVNVREMTTEPKNTYSPLANILR